MGGDVPRIKLAVLDPQTYSQRFDIYTDTASYLLVASPLASGTAPLCCVDYVAYYDLVNNTLRMATWDGALWSDLLVDSFNGQVVSPSVSLAVDRTTGEPAIAYTGSSESEVRYALWRAGSFLTQTVASGLGAVGDVSLALAQSSDVYVRIAYTAQVDKSLKLAWATGDTTTWAIDTVATFNTDPTSGQRVRLSSQAQQRDQLAFSSPEMGVVYAFRVATLPYSAGYNPLRPCQDAQMPPSASLGRALAQVRPGPGGPRPGGRPDHPARPARTVRAEPGWPALHQPLLSICSRAGALGLADPSLLWDAYRTLQNFLPGFLALAAGQGDSIVITQAMVDQANTIADRLVAAGSPALHTAINLERARYNHLQAFAGLTFGQAATLLGVDSYRTYLPLVQR